MGILLLFVVWMRLLMIDCGSWFWFMVMSCCRGSLSMGVRSLGLVFVCLKRLWMSGLLVGLFI